MIKIEHVVLASPEQMEFIIEGMRNPMNSWEKSDSRVPECCGSCIDCSDDECLKNSEVTAFILGDSDRALMQCLANAGTDHRKFMRMMPVYVRITAPLYWWKEFDIYKVGTVASGYNQTRNVMMNYEVLANIYKSRKNHKLDEWVELCKWIETLPYSELIVGEPVKTDVEENCLGCKYEHSTNILTLLKFCANCKRGYAKEEDREWHDDLYIKKED